MHSSNAVRRSCPTRSCVLSNPACSRLSAFQWHPKGQNMHSSDAVRPSCLRFSYSAFLLHISGRALDARIQCCAPPAPSVSSRFSNLPCFRPSVDVSQSTGRARRAFIQCRGIFYTFYTWPFHCTSLEVRDVHVYNAVRPSSSIERSFQPSMLSTVRLSIIDALEGQHIQCRAPFTSTLWSVPP